MRHALFIHTFNHYCYYLSELVTSNVHLISSTKNHWRDHTDPANFVDSQQDLCYLPYMEHNLGDIKFAVEAMKEGKKVRRACWPEGARIHLVKTNWGEHIDSNHPEYGMMSFCGFSNLVAEDWEVAE